MPITTNLIAGRKPHAIDSQVLATIANLPIAADSQRDALQRAGVANEKGQIYRDIQLTSEFELLQLTARLNTIGFSVNAEMRNAPKTHYPRVFVKKMPSGQKS